MTNPISADISVIKLWFERAVPEPTDKNRAVQLGVHFEEVGEMLDACDVYPLYKVGINTLAHNYKRVFDSVAPDEVDRKELLDSLCDQIVTAVGVAHMFDMDISGALSEVNRANWSKYVEGQPVFDANGKIAKGPGYTPPSLEKFL
jgi:predicted HAD superfamily Cof-like phosphohydrolase